MSSEVDTARTIVAIIAGAVVVMGAIVLLTIIYLYRERKLRTELERQADKLESLKVCETGEKPPPEWTHDGICTPLDSTESV